MSTNKPNGIANAIILSTSIGVFTIGLLTTLSESNDHFKSLMNWYNPVGPLIGKSTTGVLIWLISWILFHFLWRKKNLNFSKIWVISLILIALGFMLTFPPFFQIFEKH